MIEVTRLKGSKLVINADLIETIEATPDTVITLVNGHKYVVEESLDKVVSLIINYKGKVSGSCCIPTQENGGYNGGSC